MHTTLSLSLRESTCQHFCYQVGRSFEWASSVLNPCLFNISVNSLNDRLKAIFQNITDIIMLGEEISRTVTDMTDIKRSADQLERIQN